MSSFTITTPDHEVTLRPTGVRRTEFAFGTATYVVTNRSGQTIRTRLNLEAVTPDGGAVTDGAAAAGGADPKWFSVKGEPERDIGPGTSETFTVEIRYPGSSAKVVTSEDQRRQHCFRAMAVNLKAEDNDYERGSVISFREPVLVKADVNWRPWAIAAAALVLAVGGVTWALWPDGTPEIDLASVVDLTLEEATRTLEDQKLEVESENSTGEVPRAGQEQHYLKKVVAQAPDVPAGETVKIREGATVNLGWEYKLKQVEVPDLQHVNLEEASRRLREKGLQIGSVIQPRAPNPPDRYHAALVVGWEPRTPTAALTAVTLILDWRSMGFIVASPFDFKVYLQTIPEPVQPKLRRLEGVEGIDRGRFRDRALESGRGQ